MKFVYEPELIEYMKEKGHKNIVVELVQINNSEIEIAELHVHFVNERQTEYFKTKQHYYSVETEIGEVLLPRYKLNLEEEIVFGLKKFWIFKSISYKGITQ
jgi:hypothetical protein